MLCDSVVNNPCNGAKNTITNAGGVVTTELADALIADVTVARKRNSEPSAPKGFSEKLGVLIASRLLEKMLLQL